MLDHGELLLESSVAAVVLAAGRTAARAGVGVPAARKPAPAGDRSPLAEDARLGYFAGVVVEDPTPVPPAPLGRILLQVERHLDAGRPAEALALLGTRRTRNLHVENARGVCFLRQGRFHPAVELFRDLAVPGDSPSLAPGLPTVVGTNYATALILDGNLSGALVLLHELGREDHPSVARLKAQVAAWRRRLSWLARLNFWMYAIVPRPVELAPPVGEILYPDTVRPEPVQPHAA